MFSVDNAQTYKSKNDGTEKQNYKTNSSWVLSSFGFLVDTP